MDIGSNSMVFDGTIDEQEPDEGQEENSSSHLYNEFSKHFEQQNQSGGLAQKATTMMNSQHSNKINNKLKGILAASAQGNNKLSNGNEKDSQFEMMRDQGKLNMIKKKQAAEHAWENEQVNPSVRDDREHSKITGGGSNLLADVSNNITGNAQSKINK